MNNVSFAIKNKSVKKNNTRIKIRKYLFFYLLLVPSILIVLIFSYIPLPGIITAFLDYDPFGGFLSSPWAGLKHIKEVFAIPALYEAIFNTLKLSILSIVFTFPCPIILALLFNELRPGIFKKVVQTVSYLPNFLSWIAIIGMAIGFLDTYGTINNIRATIIGPEAERIFFMGIPELFIPNVIILSIWKGVGWGSIVYLASISSIDPQLYEAAVIDGANRWRQTIHITLPGITPMISIFLILSMAGLFSSNFELVYGLQNPFVTYETIDTVVFKQGIMGQNYSLATAVGFMQGLVAFLLVMVTNKISQKISGYGIM